MNVTKYKTFSLLLFLLLFALFFNSDAQHKYSHTSEYAGQEQREIKSLSESDIEELQTGQGWGLAKAAELNGVPGPRHLLDMKSEINLSPEQVKKIDVIFKKMKEDAIPLGKQLIELERKLNVSFAEKDISEVQLRKLLQEISDTQTELRFIHLRTHLQSLPLLTPHQIMQYNTLRGYGNTNPCEEVPEGHDPEKWRMHNNCN